MEGNYGFKDTLTELMEDNKVSVSELSVKINCDKAAIRRWLYNMYLPDPGIIIKIADYFNISADYLFDMTDRKEFEPATVSSTSFYERYVSLRDKYNYTDYFVAKECNIRDSAISKWKSVKKFPTTYSLLKLADFFHCSLDFLLGRTDK